MMNYLVMWLMFMGSGGIYDFIVYQLFGLLSW